VTREKAAVATPGGAGRSRVDREYTLGEEIANAITHGVGALASIAALVALVVAAAVWGNVWHLVSAIVYGVSLFVLYMASTLYHAIQNPKACRVFKVIDHAGIYLLIAGTYTPFTLVAIRDDGGWWLFAVVWALAITGIALEAAWVDRPRWLSSLVYLGMGWLAVFAIKPIVANLAPGGVRLLIAGGVAYTAGTVFYVMKRIKWMHAVWHLWVLAGSVLHFRSVMLYVFPRP
jgi:hemolysin III